jgi:hypothetical protein
MTPFQQGKDAFKAGQPFTANPYDPQAPFKPDEYPGNHADWRDGWLNAKATADHTERMRASNG